MEGKEIMRKLKRITLALLLCLCASNPVSAGELASNVVSTPSLIDILNATRYSGGGQNELFVHFSMDFKSGTGVQRLTSDNGVILVDFDFYMPLVYGDSCQLCFGVTAFGGMPCCPKPSFSSIFHDTTLVGITFGTIGIRKSEITPKPFTVSNEPLISLQFNAPSNGLIIVNASIDAYKGSMEAVSSLVEIGVTVGSDITSELSGTTWDLSFDNTKSKSDRFISIRNQFSVTKGVTVISLFGHKESENSFALVRGRTLFVTFIPDVGSK